MPGGYPSSWEICNGTDIGTVAASSTGTTVTSGTTSGVYGSFAELVASSAVDACFIGISVFAVSFTNSNNLLLEIAVGGAGSEVVIIKDLMLFNGSAQPEDWYYFFPVAIPAGTRISAASAPNLSGADSVKVTAVLFDGAFAQLEGPAGVDSIGITSAHGTLMANSGSANTKGSYAQLTASTPRDYLGFGFGFDPGTGGSSIANTVYLVDIAIGGAGSEQVILPNFPLQAIASGTNTRANGGIFAIPIPAGTRVAARIQNAVGFGGLAITLYGIYQ